MSDYAKPCKKCGSYYPGDCATSGCKDLDNCSCDGCDVVRYWRDNPDEDQSWFFLNSAATLIAAATDKAIPLSRGLVIAILCARLARSKSDDLEVPLVAMSSS